MKIKSILSALLLMVSSVASAQYLNVKLEDGSVRSFKTTPNMKVSFGDKAGAEPTERIVTVNGYTVRVKLAEDIPANDVSLTVYVDGNNVKILAVPPTNKFLRCTRNDNAELPALNVSNRLHTFTLSNISKDVVATVEYDQFTIHFDLLSHGQTVPEDISVMRGAEINVTASSDDGYEFRGWYMEPSCANAFSWEQITANKTDDITLYAKWVTKINGHDCVKLGGIYWATENITGAGTGYSPIWVENKKGLYYYTQANNNAMNAATSWGGTWRLPSVGQFIELMNKCSWTWMDSYPNPYGDENVAGMFVTGRSNGEIGHSIFLPAFGFKKNFTEKDISQEDWGYYWSTDAGQCLYFSKYDLRMDSSQPTTNGMFVRPVSE